MKFFLLIAAAVTLCACEALSLHQEPARPETSAGRAQASAARSQAASLCGPMGVERRRSTVGDGTSPGDYQCARRSE